MITKFNGRTLKSVLQIPPDYPDACLLTPVSTIIQRLVASLESQGQGRAVVKEGLPQEVRLLD